MQQIRERFGTNTLVGIAALLLLFSFAGDEALRLIAQQIPGADESTPCRWLPNPTDLANNQSLIGRAVVQRREPIELRVRSSTLPTAPGGLLVIRILVTNNTLGTVPFVYDPDAVLIGDNNTSGLGIVFNPNIGIGTAATNRVDTQTYAETQVRILGPQQSCVHKIEIPFELIPGQLATGTATVQAYYRGNTAGVVLPANPTPIYPDQGLWTGVIQSPPAPLPTS